MENNPNSRFKIIYNNSFNSDSKSKLLKNTEIENVILSSANSRNNPDVTVYFKNIPANQYTLGYQKFCGLKINNLVFYNTSLFDLYPNLLDFLYFEHSTKFLDALLQIESSKEYFSQYNNVFENSKLIKNTNWFINLNISFDEIINILDNITEFIYNEKKLNVLIFSSIKNKTIL